MKNNKPKTGKGWLDIIQSGDYKEHAVNLNLEDFIKKLENLKDSQIDFSDFSIEGEIIKNKQQIINEIFTFGIAVINEKGESKTLDYLQYPENYEKIKSEEINLHDKPIT